MNATPTLKVNSYLQLLGTLFLLLRKLRLAGLMSIEEDIELPNESSIFNSLPEYEQSNEVIYIFVRDVLRLMVNGYLEVNVTERYIDAYRKTTTLTEEQSSLFECAKLTLMGILNGLPPHLAVEHGRQGIPANAKPSYYELAAYIRVVNKEPEPSKENNEIKLGNFYASISAE
jgi:flagellar motor component MotA